MLLKGQRLEQPPKKNKFDPVLNLPIPKPRPRSAGFDDVPGIKVEYEQSTQRSTPRERLDKDFSALGRQIVQVAGHEENSELSFKGKVNYKIVVELDSNTMRIYSRDRGDEPILVDANGNINHERSRVTPEDITRFQSALNFLQQDHEKKVAAYER